MKIKVGKNFSVYNQYSLYLEQLVKQLLPPHKQIINKDKKDLTIEYLTILMKSKLNRMGLKPKQVIYSQEIIKKIKNHKYKTNIQLIENYIREGNDKINDIKFLSKYSFQLINEKENINKRIFIDRLLFLYNIKHLHIENVKGKEDALLFLIESNDVVYFIDIGGHKDIYDEIKLLETVDNNWGFLLNDKLKGVIGESLSRNELKVLRNNNMHCCSSVNNKVITGNIFLTGSGIPVQIVQFRDYYKTYLDNVTNIILNDKNFLNKCKEKLKTDINVNNLLFDINNNTFKKHLIFNLRSSNNRILISLDIESVY